MKAKHITMCKSILPTWIGHDSLSVTQFCRISATVLTGMTFASFAAQPYTSPATGQLQASGTVFATGASNLSDLEDKLAEKAKEQGAKGFVVNSAGGKNQMYGTATIYK